MNPAFAPGGALAGAADLDPTPPFDEIGEDGVPTIGASPGVLAAIAAADPTGTAPLPQPRIRPPGPVPAHLSPPAAQTPPVPDLNAVPAPPEPHPGE
jgi:hypothetical protein